MENMIEDVLKDIREAEKLADDLEKQAYQDGKNAVLSAEAEAQRQLALTKESVKADRKKALKDANDLAAERRKVILKKGEEAASELAEQKNSVIEETADKLVEILLEKYS